MYMYNHFKAQISVHKDTLFRIIWIEKCIGDMHNILFIIPNYL